MSDPSGISILETDYVGGFYPEMSPVRLNFTCALNGVSGPALDPSFSFCELGCGLGDTTMILAASYPQGWFVGIDLSAAHIDAAGRLAAAGCVTNVRFLAADIADLDSSTLPDFDFITMHGLYSWVPAHVRQAIDGFVQRKLKPGGVLHVSYNAQPGSHNLATLRRHYLDRAALLTGSLLERATAITAELEALRRAGAPLFRENPTAERVFEIIRDNDPRYVVHEMFAEGWQPLAFSEVHARFAAIGLRFVGDSEVLENLVEHCTLPAFTDVVKDAGDRAAQESLKDLIHNRSFRRDVYQRPAASHDSPTGAEPLLATLLCTLQRPAEISEKVKVTGATVNLAGAWFDTVRQLLSERVLSVAEILDDPALSACPRNDLLNGLKLASIDNAIGPAARREARSETNRTSTMTVVPPLNRTLLDRFDYSTDRLYLASPVTGRGVAVNRMEAMVLAAIDQHSPEAWMQSRMLRMRMTLKRPGIADGANAIDDEMAALHEIVTAFRQARLPKLAMLGVVAADSR